MATLHPFRALRPAPEAARAVAAVPYDVVSAAEARALAADRPLSFLHVSRAEIDLPPSISPYDEVVYRTAASNFARIKTAAPLVVEDAPSVYLYRLVMGPHAQTGVAACYSIEEYRTGTIRRHERTRKDKEDDRTRHMIELRAQTGPVFLTYTADREIDRLAGETTSGAPLFDFVAEDGIQHVIWRVPAEGSKALLDAFVRIPVLYIADGHHRAASAARACDALRGQSAEAERFLGVAFPHDQTQILPYHRLVKDLNGVSPSALLDRLRARCRVEPGAAAPDRKGVVAMYLDHTWYTVELQPAPAAASPADGLDVAQLQDQVLAPLLEVGDPRTDSRIDFVGGIRGPAALARAVDEGRAAVAFALYPVSVGDLMAIADSGGIMPPKSTWFEPKLRDGLLTHVI